MTSRPRSHDFSALLIMLVFSEGIEESPAVDEPMIVWDRGGLLRRSLKREAEVCRTGVRFPPAPPACRSSVCRLVGLTGFDGALRWRSTIREATAVSRAIHVKANQPFYAEAA